MLFRIALDFLDIFLEITFLLNTRSQSSTCLRTAAAAFEQDHKISKIMFAVSSRKSAEVSTIKRNRPHLYIVLVNNWNIRHQIIRVWYVMHCHWMDNQCKNGNFAIANVNCSGAHFFRHSKSHHKSWAPFCQRFCHKENSPARAIKSICISV